MKPPPRIQGIVIGQPGLGTFKLRGNPVAAYLRWPIYDVRSVTKAAVGKVLTCYCVKWATPERLADRVVYMPEDPWYVSRTEMEFEPADYWRLLARRYAFDEVCACTIPAFRSMREALPDKRVWLTPEAADPRVGHNWYNPAGPIVWAGMEGWIKSGRELITAAAEQLGRKVVWNLSSAEGWRSLKGASLVLCLRLPPNDTTMNRLCKPTIKMANAAQAGIPVLATDDPAILEFWPDVVHAPPHDFSCITTVRNLLDAALHSPPPLPLHSFDLWLRRMAAIL